MKKIEALDGLRGWMALWVVFFHSASLAGFNIIKNGSSIATAIDGTLAVDVFILLSGFVISVLLRQKGELYLPFIIRRALRLFPVYFFVLIISISMLGFTRSTLKQIPFSTTKNVERVEIIDKTKEHFSFHVLSHLILFQGIIPDKVLPLSSYSLVGQAWSLSLEWQFYLIAPFLIALIVGRRMKWWIAGVVFAAIYIGGIINNQPAFLPNKLYLFVAGIISQEIWFYFCKGKLPADKSLLILFAMGIILCVPVSKMIIPWSIWMLSLASILTESKLLAPVRFLLTNSFSQFIGRISYSIYCLHMITLLLVVRFCLPISTSRIVYVIGVFLGGFIATIGISYLVHIAIEKPGMDLGREIASQISKKTKEKTRELI